jgi:hypothetical protein
MPFEVHPDSLPPPHSTPRSRYARVLVWCKACRHQREADVQALVKTGRGDGPLVKLRFRCSNCGSRLTDWVVRHRLAACIPPASYRALHQIYPCQASVR